MICEATGQSGSFDYVINDVRKGHENHQLIFEELLLFRQW